MTALASVSASAWIPEDDLLLKNAVEVPSFFFLCLFDYVEIRASCSLLDAGDFHRLRLGGSVDSTRKSFVNQLGQAHLDENFSRFESHRMVDLILC